MRRQAVLELASPQWRSTNDGTVRFWTSISTDSPIPLAALHAGDYASIPGNWAAIVLSEDSVTLAVDSSRSVSLLYARVDGSRGQGNEWVIADDPEELRPHLPSWEADPEQAKLFSCLGYSVGADTLIAGVHTVQAGSSVILEYATDPLRPSESVSFFDVLRFRDERCDDSEAYAMQFSKMLDDTIGHVVNEARGRQLAVPLSGGIDSRLLLLWLKRMGVSNVVAFTYGVAGSSEALVSQGIAQQLGVPWLMVPIDPSALREAWEGSEGDDFIAATWGGTSLPHVQDWYALREMSRKGLITPDAIILPGHTVVGSMHDEDLLELSPSVQQVLHAFQHHHSLQRPPRRSMRKSHPFEASALSALHQVRETRLDGDREKNNARNSNSSQVGLDELELQSWIEWFNLRERQAKYINNSMRAYEFFGWQWALPMCTPAAREVWARGSTGLTLTRDWYREFTNREYAAFTGEPAPYHSPVSTSMPAGPKRAILAVMRATKLDIVLARVRSIRVMLRHPMGFSGFIRDRNTARVAASMLAGQTAMGLWANDFLHNRWGGGRNTVPPIRKS